MRRHSRGSANDAASLATLSSSSPMPGIPRRSSAAADSKPLFATTPRHGSASPTPKHEFPTTSHLGLSLNAAAPSSQSQTGDSPESTTSTLVPSTPEESSPPPLSVSRRLSARGDHSPPKLSLLQRQRSDPRRSRPLSAGDLPSPPEPTSAVSPGYEIRTIRKKSGEIVKPSLKTRSMSTPDLGRGARTPGEDGDSPTRSSHDLHTKSVRFNDLGGLESVVHFLRGQKVTALSRSPDDPPTETDTDNDTDLSDFVHFRTRRSLAKSQAEESREVQVAASSSVPRLRVDFGPGTQGILKDEYVILERYDLQNAPLAMRGTVLVRNVAFQKCVTVRFTLDHWQTVSEVSAQHVSHVPAATTGDEGWDRFGFTIKLDDYKRKIEERALLLCIRYNTEGGREWWDSNNGDNYRFTFKRAAARRPAARSTRPHSFHAHSHSDAFGLPTLRLGRQSAMNSRDVRSWTFPRTGSQTAHSSQPETNAKTHQSNDAKDKDPSPPQSPPPRAAFEPPVRPDVHSHLRLKTYCAPSPPPSPPKSTMAALPLAPVRGRAGGAGNSPPMTLVHGRPANSWPPAIPVTATKRDAATSPPRDKAGSPLPSTPPCTGAAPLFDSPTQTSSSGSGSEDEKKNSNGPRKSRSNGNLQALAMDDPATDAAGLITPPSSNLSSPPTPSAMLPVPLTPSATASVGSTNDSSPLLTVPPSDDEDHGPGLPADSRRILNAATYQEFIDKFCFFESPPTVSAPLAEPTAYRPVWPKSGLSSPSNGYVGRHALSHAHSPRATTPTQKTYASEADYFSERSATPTLSTGFVTPRSSPPTQASMAA
ncbi:hypothetical protein A1Q1_01160 [Trichosporon asahii var. asahii CBS 2479]|uniref:CBM21 domain-containing protein n=1 Tax=Trichosporon asahii var. asahii (strain ATCC 90039 / CBS 2479 / JCM 2466 / KCTC 7840 / NBRC 103889/ NCYC 2677 / UAMH 7654) TaxID=1186058 RepID=J6F377_TRIAS|nr:hypothetical protein A1Q1_01160 [Trichosporon asahii var. asahii CBS 2479]EJT49662.1 hypothetical protein A1Q1_01160 [Trichosporon asahii var. asahii CBS 2479]